MSPSAQEQAVLTALRRAASKLRVDASELRLSQYRSLRERGNGRYPSECAVREAFGSWERARERLLRS